MSSARRSAAAGVKARAPRRANLRRLLVASLAAAALALATPAHASVSTGFLYVTDYGKSELDRYQYTYDSVLNQITALTPDGAGNNTSNAYFLGGGSNPVKEGLQGTSNDLIIVGGSHGSASTVITRYTLDGSIIGTIPVSFTGVYANPGIGNVAITSDGKYMYAPLESAGYLVKIDLSNGNIIASYKLAGAHDVAIAANGDVYVSDYASGPQEIVHLDSNLDFENVLVTHFTGFRPSGLSIAADGSLYVQNNTAGGHDSVLHYDLTGSGAGLTATLDVAGSYLGSPGNNALEFTFGTSMGPDGNLYIAALGGGGNGGFSTADGYQDGVYELNTSTDALTQSILGYTETAGPAGPSGLVAPKYLQFDTDFIDAPDAGYTPTPEPASMALVAAAAVGLAYAATRRRRA
jgi:hypothetical protein